MFNLLKIFLIGFFYLVFFYNSTYSAQQITGEVGVKTTLRICADPNNLPYSNQNNEGYENKILRNLKADILYCISRIYAETENGQVIPGFSSERYGGLTRYFNMKSK